jgi:SAM-dependent methyltransferase
VAPSDEADRVIGLYRRHAQDWARDRGNRLFETRWIDHLKSLVPAGAPVLDLGCGSGQPIADDLIRSGYKLTGIDSAPEMIAMCHARFPDHDWIVADMRCPELGQTFKGVLAWDSLFHLKPDDRRSMFPIFRRLAGLSAALMFTSGPESGVAIGTYAGEPLYHASLAPDEYRALLAENGFAVVRHVAEDPDCGGRTVWLAQRGDEIGI